MARTKKRVWKSKLQVLAERRAKLERKQAVLAEEVAKNAAALLKCASEHAKWSAKVDAATLWAAKHNKEQDAIDEAAVPDVESPWNSSLEQRS